MTVQWLPASRIFSTLYHLTNRRFGYVSRLCIKLDDPRALGLMTIQDESGNCLLRLCDQLNTARKQFLLPHLPEDQNLSLCDTDGNVLHQKLVHTPLEQPQPPADEAT